MPNSWIPTSLRGRIAAALALLGVAVFFTWLFSAAPTGVDTAAVDAGPIEVTIDEEGVARIREVYQVSAPVAGLVRRSPVEVGDPVVQGVTTVARITRSAPAFLDSRAQKTAEAQVRAAEAALTYAEASVERAEAELQFAREDLKRAEALVVRKTVSQRSRDQAALLVKTQAAALENAKAEVEVRRQELDQAKATLLQPDAAPDVSDPDCCVSVTAPVDGRVLKVMVESAQVVAIGTPLLEIGDPEELEISVDLLSTDAVKVKEGDRAYVERWGGEPALSATVRRIEPAGFEDVSALGIEEQRVQVLLDLDGDPEAYARLGHDYRVFVRVVSWREEEALRAPLSALFRQGKDWAVFVDADGEARLRKVEVGRRNAVHAQILGGVKAGERVILHPSDAIEDGAPVVERAP